MNRITLAVRFVLAVTISATPSTAGTTSDVDVKSGVYKTLCVEGQSTGYKWVDGKWQPADFTTTKYLIQKVDPTDKMAGKCAQTVRDKPGDDVVGVTACYRFRNLGVDNADEPPMPIDIFERAVRDTPRSTKTCKEYWKKRYFYGKPYIDFVWCADFETIVFQPNGEFMRSKMVPYFEYAQREPAVMSVGKCSIVE